jgi:rsbT co-antagonist protein RsbR
MAERGVVRRGPTPFVEFAVDAGLRVTDWGPRAERAFGAPRAAALGRSIAELIPIADGEAWRSLLVEDDAAHTWPLARAGDERVFEWVHTCLYDVDDRVCGALGHGREVTARAREERLAALDRKILRAMYDTVNVALWAIDEAGTFLVQDGRASMIPPGTLVGANVFALPGGGEGDADVRRALAGEAKHNVMMMAGRDWESWLVPLAPERAGDAAVIGISLDITEGAQRERELRAQLEVIDRQQQALRAMSTPIIEVWDRVLCLPILGLVDSVRTADIMESLLQAVVRVRARFAILDMTGVEVVDTSTAGHLLGLVRAIELLGARGIVTGIRPNIAETIVTLGLDLSRIAVFANLREALKHCLAATARAG